jgi:hypothetical protein
MSDNGPKFPDLYYNADSDTNHDSWIINIKAKLRPKGLWACTQTAHSDRASEALKNKHIDTADMITHHISGGVKAKLPATVFDDGYLMLTEIKNIIVPATEQTFFASAQELFSLRLGYDNAENLDAFLTRIKILNEKIESTKIEFTPDKRTLLVLMLGLTDQYESLVRIWATIPDLTAERAIQILRADAQREEDRERIKYGHTFSASNGHNQDHDKGFAAVGHKRPALSCRACGKHPARTECWANKTCGFCRKKGHPESWCYDKHGRPEGAGSTLIVTATGANATYGVMGVCVDAGETGGAT